MGIDNLGSSLSSDGIVKLILNRRIEVSGCGGVLVVVDIALSIGASDLLLDSALTCSD